MNLDFSATIPQIPFILEGLAITLKIVVVSAIIGLILGIVLSLCRSAHSARLSGSLIFIHQCSEARL